MTPVPIHISETDPGLSNLSAGKRSTLVECCVLCLHDNSHLPGTKLPVDVSGQTQVVEIKWRPDEFDVSLLTPLQKGQMTASRGTVDLDFAPISAHLPRIRARISLFEPCCPCDSVRSGLFAVESLLRNSWDLIERVEHGAEAIAIVTVPKLTAFKVLKRSFIGTGVDYTLGKDTENGWFSDDDAKLEVSGILRETASNKLTTRVSAKIKQTQKYDGTENRSIVFVVEFGTPKAAMVARNV